MIFILDTDVYSLVELRDSPESLRLHARILEYDGEYKVVTTVVTYEEQTRGWLAYAAKSMEIGHQLKAYERLRRHLLSYLDIEVLAFDARAAEHFLRLRRLKLKVGAADLKIASIALAHGAILLTRNLLHFGRVPGLRAEDWTKP